MLKECRDKSVGFINIIYESLSVCLVSSFVTPLMGYIVFTLKSVVQPYWYCLSLELFDELEKWRQTADCNR